MSRLRVALPCCLIVLFLTAPAVAQDQKFALRFGFNLVEATGDTEIDGDTNELDTMGGFEVNFEWYFHPRVGFDVSTAGAANADVESGGDKVAGVTFSTFTLGINGHPVRSEKVDFGLGLLAGGATYGDFEVEDSTTTISTERDTVFGAQAFVDMSVGRKWAVDVGLKYLSTELELKDGPKIDFNPVVLRVMGVYRWGKQK